LFKLFFSSSLLSFIRVCPCHLLVTNLRISTLRLMIPGKGSFFYR
jgi:hypothetical protein